MTSALRGERVRRFCRKEGRVRGFDKGKGSKIQKFVIRTRPGPAPNVFQSHLFSISILDSASSEPSGNGFYVVVENLVPAVP